MKEVGLLIGHGGGVGRAHVGAVHGRVGLGDVAGHGLDGGRRGKALAHVGGRGGYGRASAARSARGKRRTGVRGAQGQAKGPNLGAAGPLWDRGIVGALLARQRLVVVTSVMGLSSVQVEPAGQGHTVRRGVDGGRQRVRCALQLRVAKLSSTKSAPGYFLDKRIKPVAHGQLSSARTLNHTPASPDQSSFRLFQSWSGQRRLVSFGLDSLPTHYIPT